MYELKSFGILQRLKYDYGIVLIKAIQVSEHLLLLSSVRTEEIKAKAKHLPWLRTLRSPGCTQGVGANL